MGTKSIAGFRLNDGGKGWCGGVGRIHAGMAGPGGCRVVKGSGWAENIPQGLKPAVFGYLRRD